MSEYEDVAQSPPRPLFLTTHWSVVLTAKDKAAPGCSQALETLCRTYWYPLYAFIRGSGYSPHDAQDLTQGFFARLLAKNYLRVVDPEKGRFRTFLKMALKRFLTHEWERNRAEKRGSGQPCLSFDTTTAEHRFQQSTNAIAPDQIYDQNWALTILAEVTARLEQEYVKANKLSEFMTLRPYLTAERGGIPYEQIASAMQTTEGAARVAVHRLRKRFRQLFREVIAETVSEAAEVDEELRHLVRVLSRS